MAATITVAIGTEKVVDGSSACQRSSALKQCA